MREGSAIHESWKLDWDLAYRSEHGFRDGEFDLCPEAVGEVSEDALSGCALVPQPRMLKEPGDTFPRGVGHMLLLQRLLKWNEWSLIKATDEYQCEGCGMDDRPTIRLGLPRALQ